ncbi:hypothetical protein DFH29DRAFT_1008433 [Suillus ampliporus]|nr:hypothetical protein DFH29DRAFT_1008433 [Suillus ampliporus]
MVKGRYGHKLTRLEKQFHEENGARHGAQAAAAQNAAQNPAVKRPRNVDSSHNLHAHTSVDVTNMGCPSVRTVYYPAPKVTPATPARTEADGSISETFNLDTNFDAVDNTYIDFLAEHNTNTEPVKSKQNRTAGDDPQRLWVRERDSFLKEFIRLEARGDAPWSHACHGLPDCVNEPTVHCRDCKGLQLYCRSCTVSLHSAMPLHNVEFWTDMYFQQISLQDLGLCIQLGHPAGIQCDNPVRAFDFTVLDINGIHSVSLFFCNCATAKTRTIQLLRSCWYPATTTDPRTTATFHLLDNFQMYTFKSKGSAFEYWQALSRLSDNTGTKPPKDRYEALLRMSRQYRHLLALKRAGRAHNVRGVLGTKPGELAVPCPACPQPGRNLLPGWDSAPPNDRWLFALFLGIDANFRMCHCNKSSEEVDLSLSKGWAYFMEESGFKGLLAEHAGQTQEKSSCASHNAVNLADSKNVHGLAATGIGAVVCARHNFKRPSAVGDLQKGEKYVNMDFLIFSMLTHSSDLAVFNISYNIACQWSKHLWTRMSHYPSKLHFSPGGKTITFLVPKFHLPAHIPACQTTFLFNLIKGMARTDGEAPERAWSNINPVATSTREMGPGSRQDTLDDHFSDWNWRKVCNFGPFLLQKLKEAIPQWDQHRQMVEEWEADWSKPNPFKSAAVPVTQASVCLELSQAEADQLKRGLDVSLHAEVSPSVLIAAGTDLEAQQCHLATDKAVVGMHSTDIQLSALQQWTNTLHRQLEHWVKIQTLYMPYVARLRETDDLGPESEEEAVHNVKLWLPSAVLKLPMHCDTNLTRIEWQLRVAQAHEALHELRQNLRLKRHLTGFKRDWIRGQHAHTRSRGIIDTVQKKIDAAATKYNIAWSALEVLAKVLLEVEWMNQFPKLEKEDIRGMTEEQAASESQTEGRRLVAISWIWKQYHGAGREELSNAMRIEWCKARARASRWSEEVELLQEEMRWVSAFLEWQTDWWEDRATPRTWLDEMENKGASAYAHRQPAICQAMRTRCISIWSIVPGLVASSSDVSPT